MSLNNHKVNRSRTRGDLFPGVFFMCFFSRWLFSGWIFSRLLFSGCLFLYFRLTFFLRKKGMWLIFWVTFFPRLCLSVPSEKMQISWNTSHMLCDTFRRSECSSPVLNFVIINCKFVSSSWNQGVATATTLPYRSFLPFSHISHRRGQTQEDGQHSISNSHAKIELVSWAFQKNIVDWNNFLYN